VFVESQTPFKICGEASHGTEAIEKARSAPAGIDSARFGDASYEWRGRRVCCEGNAAPHKDHPIFPCTWTMFPDRWRPRLASILRCRKSDGITKLGEHLKALLPPIDAVTETPNPETSQGISQKPV